MEKQVSSKLHLQEEQARFCLNMFCQHENEVERLNRSKKRNFMVPFYGLVATVSRLQIHYEEKVYFLPFSS